MIEELNISSAKYAENRLTYHTAIIAFVSQEIKPFRKKIKAFLWILSSPNKIFFILACMLTCIRN